MIRRFLRVIYISLQSSFDGYTLKDRVRDNNVAIERVLL